MARDNIYDLIISELILRVETLTSTVTAPNILLSSTLPGNTVAEGFNGNTVFTSTVVNIPSGYSIQTNSHVITYPVALPVSTVGSVDAMTGPSVNVILGAAGSTFTVNTTVTLEHLTSPDIILNGSFVITSVLPIYYGVKAYSVSPDTTGLSTISSSSVNFQMVSSILGRLYIVAPVALPLVVSVVDQNGLVYSVEDEFTVSVIGTLRYYILNHDTQLTGTDTKIFTILY